MGGFGAKGLVYPGPCNQDFQVPFRANRKSPKRLQDRLSGYGRSILGRLRSVSVWGPVSVFSGGYVP
jgi:hypothetical protein